MLCALLVASLGVGSPGGSEAPASTEEDAGSWESEDLDAWLAGVEGDDDEGPTRSEGERVADYEDEGGDADPSRAPTAASTSEGVVMGSMRLMGAYLHFPDLPPPLPQDDDGIAAGVGRLLVDQKARHVAFEMNLFADLSRVPVFSSIGTFATAGATESAYRNPGLTWTLWEDGRIAGRLGVDRFAVKLAFHPVSVSLGRFPINHSVTMVLTPNDVFAPFSATAINKIYKPGVDAARVSVSPGPLSTAEIEGVMGYTDDGEPSWGRSALLARIATVRWSFEWALLGGKIAERWLVGGSLQGNLGRVGLRAEGHLGVPDLDGGGRDDDDPDPYGRLSAGPNLAFAWHNLAIGTEYAFFSDGADSADDYLQRAARFFPDDLPYLGRHYVGAYAGLDTIPILRLSALGFVNALDGSGLAGLGLDYSIADEAQFVAGAYIPWGRRPTPPDPTIPGFIRLRSEYGLVPMSIYLETRFFF